MPEWKMLEDLPKFNPLIISSESQAKKSKKFKHTPPIAAMKCLAIGLWLVLAVIVLADALAVFPALNFQDIPLGIGSFFHVMLIIPPLLATYLMFRRLCPKYFSVFGILGLAALWIVVNLAWGYLETRSSSTSVTTAPQPPNELREYLGDFQGFSSRQALQDFQNSKAYHDFKDSPGFKKVDDKLNASTNKKVQMIGWSHRYPERIGCLLLFIPFLWALFHGWSRGIVGWRQSYRLASPVNGRAQATTGLVLMLLLTCIFIWAIKQPLVEDGQFYWKFVLGLILVSLIFVVFTRGINRVFSFGLD